MPADQQAAESRWVAQVARGDRGALQSLYETYFPRLTRFFSHLTAAPVEDLINDTFLDVWRHSGTFNGQDSVWVWIMRLALDHARRRESTDTLDASALTYLVYTGGSRDEVAEILNLSFTTIDMLLMQSCRALREGSRAQAQSLDA